MNSRNVQATYEQIKRNQVAFTANQEVYETLEELRRHSFNSFMDVMNRWEGNQVAWSGFKLVKDLVNAETPSTGRLIIRLAILQALSDVRRPMTQKEILAYWKDNIGQMLSHEKAKEIYPKINGVLHDVASMAGVAIPNRLDPSPHPSPPIERMLEGDTTSDAAGTPAPTKYQYTQGEKAEFDEIGKKAEHLGPTERQAFIIARINQHKFRALLLERWERCAVTDIENNQLLVASHIKPWSASEPAERLDPDNGLLLAAHIDKLFDTGLITFDDDGSMVFSSALSIDDQARLGINDQTSLRLSMGTATRQYMLHHRTVIFRP